jgi:hypothetical protein
MIPEPLVSFLESGISVLIGSASLDLRPSCARVVGTHVSTDRSTLTVLVPEIPGHEVLKDLELSRRAAVLYTRAIDNRSIQLKGDVSTIRPATEAELIRARNTRKELATMLALIGLPRNITERLAIHPLRAVEIRISSLYRQTPGPDAGGRLGEGT